MALEMLFSGRILLLHLLVEFLKDLNMFLGILDIRRYLGIFLVWVLLPRPAPLL
jgi:hypothetical protein